MNTFQHCQSAVAIAALLVATAASATTMSKPEYTAAKSRVSADYKIDKAACAKFSGNEKDVCQEQSKGKQSVALAELEFSYTGKPKDANKVAVAKAEAAYAVARELCDDKGANAKDLCVTEAKAARTKALADATLDKKIVAASRDAVDDKREADYKVATEKCDSLAGDAKSACVSEVKARFNKS